ncbi:hypothetical protein NDU88_004584 [Pleurodeles waltl]|uniref:Uncharacterized protein n=1 Tax=Pleurodeles waltl TaxID=8319 RepID=A0AAV7TRP7_PLEWA|nr:hypothetical protein NDU88_004584 [Pleurodeles waltl]
MLILEHGDSEGLRHGSCLLWASRIRLPWILIQLTVLQHYSPSSLLRKVLGPSQWTIAKFQMLSCTLLRSPHKRKVLWPMQLTTVISVIYEGWLSRPTK